MFNDFDGFGDFIALLCGAAGGSAGGCARFFAFFCPCFGCWFPWRCVDFGAWAIVFLRGCSRDFNGVAERMPLVLFFLHLLAPLFLTLPCRHPINPADAPHIILLLSSNSHGSKSKIAGIKLITMPFSEMST